MHALSWGAPYNPSVRRARDGKGQKRSIPGRPMRQSGDKYLSSIRGHEQILPPIFKKKNQKISYTNRDFHLLVRNQILQHAAQLWLGDHWLEPTSNDSFRWDTIPDHPPPVFILPVWPLRHLGAPVLLQASLDA